MTNIKWIIFYILILQLSFALTCTTAIVSGKHTVDGKPLIWKHRDSGFMQNKLMRFEGEKHAFIGLINSVDSTGKEVWGGCNDAGFAIINSASYNLNIDDTTKLKDQEGIVMKQALASCSNLQDFESMLLNWPKPMGVEANFGVIDAQGGAAYYETTNFDFKKVDVNDPAIAPFGYVIRTNYSFNGQRDDGYGYIRYLTAEKLFYNAAAENDLSARFILQDVSRSLEHSLTNTDLRYNAPNNHIADRYVHFQDYIPRYSTCAPILIQGVNSIEQAEQATIWTILGFPLTTVVFPTWVESTQLPGILTAEPGAYAQLCDWGLELKKQCFPITRGSGKKYMNLPAVYNQQGSGLVQKILAIENIIFEETTRKTAEWAENGYHKTAIVNYYNWLESYIKEQYSQHFGFN